MKLNLPLVALNCEESDNFSVDMEGGKYCGCIEIMLVFSGTRQPGNKLFLWSLGNIS